MAFKCMLCVIRCIPLHHGSKYNDDDDDDYDGGAVKYNDDLR